MNNMNQDQPPVPPPIPPVGPQTTSGRLPSADDPRDREPITSVMSAVESILRQPRRVLHALRQPEAWRVIGAMLFASILCALIYGVIVGTFSRGEQLWIAPVKIAAGLMLSALICLPSLYVFGCLSGSQARLSEMVGLVVGLLLLMTVLLMGFAPVAWLFSESTNSICWMGALHLAFWAVAAMFGLRFVGAGFAATQASLRSGLCLWAIIYLLVTLQMTSALRPILGTANTFLPTEKKFFLNHWADCARIKVESRASPQTR